jgi:hypothetical protein
MFLLIGNIFLLVSVLPDAGTAFRVGVVGGCPLRRRRRAAAASWNLDRKASTVRLHASSSSSSGQGFGSNGRDPNNKNKKNENIAKHQPTKTYGTIAESMIRDVIDEQGAMEAFFGAREEWLPIFRSVAGTRMPADTERLLNNLPKQQQQQQIFEFHESSSPWRKHEGIPRDPQDRQVLSRFLDSMHQSLLDIPTTESEDSEEDDEDDIQFIEEGRRMLAINRFHVLRENHGGSVESMDALFSHCWSELHELKSTDQEHTGSIILLPDYQSLSDLRRFADMNILRPLQWLGVHTEFEVVSLQRDSPAIRLLYKLSEIPSGDSYTDEDGFAASNKT